MPMACACGHRPSTHFVKAGSGAANVSDGADATSHAAPSSATRGPMRRGGLSIVSTHFPGQIGAPANAPLPNCNESDRPDVTKRPKSAKGKEQPYAGAPRD